MLFCTSTLIEGVNLPADNLFVTDFKNGTKHMKPVDFRNLIGRVGRLEYNLYGNVFLVAISEKAKEKYEQLLEAARRAQALEFIEEQGGLDAPVAIKGANLSGGQKQRLLLARALAGDPDILLLDDSSSALDYRTDSKLREEIRLHCADATKIIIAQRISSIMHAEKIMVLENGNVIGMGTHEELMETCPLYREIGESQIGEGLAKEVHA